MHLAVEAAGRRAWVCREERGHEKGPDATGPSFHRTMTYSPDPRNQNINQHNPITITSITELKQTLVIYSPEGE